MVYFCPCYDSLTWWHRQRIKNPIGEGGSLVETQPVRMRSMHNWAEQTGAFRTDAAPSSPGWRGRPSSWCTKRWQYSSTSQPRSTSRRWVVEHHSSPKPGEWWSRVSISNSYSHLRLRVIRIWSMFHEWWLSRPLQCPLSNGHLYLIVSHVSNSYSHMRVIVIQIWLMYQWVMVIRASFMPGE